MKLNVTELQVFMEFMLVKYSQPTKPVAGNTEQLECTSLVGLSSQQPLLLMAKGGSTAYNSRHAVIIALAMWL